MQEPPKSSANRPKSSSSRLIRSLGWVLVVVSSLLLFYGVIAYFAWESGNTSREAEATREQAAELETQLRLAREDVAAGNFELALRRLDYVQTVDQAYSDAQNLRQEAQAGLDALLTPSPTPTPVPPTPTPTATPEGGVIPPLDEEAAEAGYQVILELMEERDFAQAVEEIPAFQAEFPGYKRPETDQMLFDAYLTYGLRLLDTTDQIELGLFYLSLAEELSDLSDPVQGQITYAELYLEGIVFSGVNWPAYLYSFRQLCEFAPLYQNSCNRLYVGLVGYGDQLAVAQDWCPAEDHYREAFSVVPQNERELLSSKLDEATTRCQEATPTPTATPEGGVPTPDPAATPTPEG